MSREMISPEVLIVAEICGTTPSAILEAIKTRPKNKMKAHLKIQPEEVKQIRQAFEEGVSLEKLAEVYKTTRPAITTIVKGLTRPNGLRARLRPAKEPRTMRPNKLSPDDVKQIKNDFGNGMSLTELANRHDVTRGAIRFHVQLLIDDRKQLEAGFPVKSLAKAYKLRYRVSAIAKRYQIHKDDVKWFAENYIDGEYTQPNIGDPVNQNTLSSDGIRQLRDSYYIGQSISELSDQFNISMITVKIHVENISRQKDMYDPKGWNCDYLDPEDIKQIRKLYISGQTVPELAKAYNVGNKTIDFHTKWLEPRD